MYVTLTPYMTREKTTLRADRNTAVRFSGVNVIIYYLVHVFKKTSKHNIFIFFFFCIHGLR